MSRTRASYWSPGAAGPVLGYEEGGWQDDAACRRADPELFFPRLGENAAEAKRICARCPVRSECLSYAMGRPDLQGVWGGLTDEERRDASRARAAARAVRRTPAPKKPYLVLPELTEGELGRFRSHVKPGGCGVIWTGAVDSNGTAVFRYRRVDGQRRVTANRIIYKLATGKDPGNDYVRPACGNALCCTPGCLVTVSRPGRKAAA